MISEEQDVDVVDSIKPAEFSRTGIYAYEDVGSLNPGPYCVISPGEKLMLSRDQKVADPTGSVDARTGMPLRYAHRILPGALFPIINSGEWVDGRYIEGGHHPIRYKQNVAGHTFLRDGAEHEKAVAIYASQIKNTILEAHGLDSPTQNTIGVITEIPAFSEKPLAMTKFRQFNQLLYPIPIEPDIVYDDAELEGRIKSEGGLAVRESFVKQFKDNMADPSFVAKNCPDKTVQRIWNDALEQILYAYMQTRNFLDFFLTSQDRQIQLQERNAAGKAMYDLRDQYAMWLLHRKGVDSVLTDIVNQEPQVIHVNGGDSASAIQQAVAAGIAQGLQAIVPMLNKDYNGEDGEVPTRRRKTLEEKQAETRERQGK